MVTARTSICACHLIGIDPTSALLHKSGWARNASPARAFIRPCGHRASRVPSWRSISGSEFVPRPVVPRAYALSSQDRI
jgi:hypothetical protein